MRTLVFLAGYAALTGAGKVEVGEVTLGEHTGTIAKGAVYTERSSFSIAVKVDHEGKNPEDIGMAAVRFTHKESGAESWVSLSHTTTKWEADVDMRVHADETFAFRSGEYAAALLISDPAFATQTEREIGSVEMKLTPTPAWKQKQEFGDQKDWVRKVPQKWDIKPDEARASGLSALIFTGLLAVPVLVLFGLLFNAGVNFQGLFDNPLTFVRSVVFHGSLVAICFFIVTYWLHVGLFTTVCLLLPSGVVAFVFRPKASAVVRAPEKKKQE